MAANPPTVEAAQDSDERQRLLELFSFGFDRWLLSKCPPDVLTHIETIGREPIGRAQLNQLLHLCHEAGVSDGFYRYYWLTAPKLHPYEVVKLPGYSAEVLQGDLIRSHEHLKWGLYRLYVDALLFYGDVRIAFNKLRALSSAELDQFFQSKRFDDDAMARRGPAISLRNIAKDNRYLISEMACKSYAPPAEGQSNLKSFLMQAFEAHSAKGGGRTTIRKLMTESFSKPSYKDRQSEFLFSADDILDEEVESQAQIAAKHESVLRLFEKARADALFENTKYFLSMVNDLDVYVATSMRDRSDFRKMADFCEKVFRASTLKPLSLRYFDPTVSAAEGHEDKGLIECLMVKSAKVLVDRAGDRKTALAKMPRPPWPSVWENR